MGPGAPRPATTRCGSTSTPGSDAAVITRLERFKLRTKCDSAVEADVAGVAVRGTSVENGLACGWPGVDGVDVLGAEHR